MNVLYPAQITFDKSDHRFFVQFLDIPEAITEGESEEEALFNASESLTLAIEGRLGDHTTSEIARSLNTSWPAVSRLEDPKHWPSLRQLEKVANVLGQQLIISMEPLFKGDH